jgi:LmbE family N-acetylglucosaminyl deacetylase
MRASVIIAALNEQPTIAAVVRAARRAACVGEVIVVSDGSTDGTADAARRAGADTVVELPRTVGKAGAVLAGAARARHPVAVLLDADLLGLRPDHVDALARPVLAGDADMVVGTLGGDRLQAVLPGLSGQRAVPTWVLLAHPHLQRVGFGLERSLNALARRCRWRVVEVVLDGLTHRRKEHKYGLVKGYRAKLRAMEEIALPSPVARRAPTAHRVGAVAVVVAMVHILSGLFAGPTSAAHLAQVAPPRPDDRVLVVTAHNDDETLAAGGYLAAARQAGATVTVVIVTNGDGNRLSAAVLGRRLRPRPADYVREGRLRQRESLLALQTLGVPAGAVVFLGYPDRGLDRLLTDHWDRGHPYTSPFTKASSSPYPHAYRPGAPYTGEDLLDLLTEVTVRARPTVVITHALLDEHPDHQAVHTFVTLALDRAASAGLPRPRRYGVLIHARDFPRPLRYAPDRPLLPPTRLREVARWASYPLSADLLTAKHRALQAYRSQYDSPYLRLLLSSFQRRNELFIEDPAPAR